MAHALRWRTVRARAEDISQEFGLPGLPLPTEGGHILIPLNVPNVLSSTRHADIHLRTAFSLEGLGPSIYLKGAGARNIVPKYLEHMKNREISSVFYKGDEIMDSRAYWGILDRSAAEYEVKMARVLEALWGKHFEESPPLPTYLGAYRPLEFPVLKKGGVELKPWSEFVKEYPEFEEADPVVLVYHAPFNVRVYDLRLRYSLPSARGNRISRLIWGDILSRFGHSLDRALEDEEYRKRVARDILFYLADRGARLMGVMHGEGWIGGTEGTGTIFSVRNTTPLTFHDFDTVRRAEELENPFEKDISSFDLTLKYLAQALGAPELYGEAKDRFLEVYRRTKKSVERKNSPVYRILRSIASIFR